MKISSNNSIPNNTTPAASPPASLSQASAAAMSTADEEPSGSAPAGAVGRFVALLNGSDAAKRNSGRTLLNPLLVHALGSPGGEASVGEIVGGFGPDAGPPTVSKEVQAVLALGSGGTISMEEAERILEGVGEGAGKATPLQNSNSAIDNDFHALDVNGDGKLDSAEITRALKSYASQPGVGHLLDE
jgi:hypothetical protein